MQKETLPRSFLKAISYRVLGTLVTAAIALAVTGQIPAALAIGALDFFSKIGLFVVHERLWHKVRYGKYEAQPVVLWFTGFSGSGKTTLALRLAQSLRSKGLKVEHLDGDGIRQILPDVGFTREQRNAHIQRVGLLASYLQKNGVSVVASFISPYEESRQFVRGLCQNFVEIHLATPLAECEKRDVKGLYAKARKGELPNFTGVDDVYETPLNPELRLDTSVLSIEDTLERIEGHLKPLVR